MESVVSEHTIRTLLKEQGMVNMLQDGMLKAANGITSVEEVMRVVDDKRA